jgi:hypothetical protein
LKGVSRFARGALFFGKELSNINEDDSNTRAIDPTSIYQGAGRLFFTDKSGKTEYVGRLTGDFSFIGVEVDPERKRTVEVGTQQSGANEGPT